MFVRDADPRPWVALIWDSTGCNLGDQTYNMLFIGKAMTWTCCFVCEQIITVGEVFMFFDFDNHVCDSVGDAKVFIWSDVQIR